MKVGFCGSGAWGITLANLIAGNGHEVLVWSIEDEVIKSIEQGKGHPRFPNLKLASTLRMTRNLKDLMERDAIVESVTAKGFREVCNQLQALGGITKPFILTSKGIEQETEKLLVRVAFEILKKEHLIGCMSGPTLAKEVMDGQPTAAVGAGSQEVVSIIKKLFESPHFHIFGSPDILGVALGGAMKNVIAIATGLSEGAGYGNNTKAYLITMGLAEMRKMAKAVGAQEDTCFGLSGIGDLIVTGVSNLSRNFSFGKLLGEGLSKLDAIKKVEMVVEGEYTVLSAYHVGKKHNLHLPITYAMYAILYEGKDAKKTLSALLAETPHFA